MAGDLLPATPLDRICQRFEKAWQNGESPDLDCFLSEAGSAALPELAALDLKCRLTLNMEASAAGYFQRFPQLLEDPDKARQLVAVEWCARRTDQPHLQEADFLARYSNLFTGDDSRWVAWLKGAVDPVSAANETTDFFQSPESETSAKALKRSGAQVSELPDHELRQATVGDTIAGFRLLSVLGEGGFGTVFRAEDMQLHRKVAVKVIRSSVAMQPGVPEMFLAEARAMAAVQHDHVVPIYQVISEDGRLCIAMPLLAGESLASRLEREGALPTEEVLRIGREAAAGLAAIHAKGLVHRDLKPSNLWLESGSGRVKVLDLGLAQDPLTHGEGISGSPPYMSPEQTESKLLDLRSDLFSLGAVLYECATGRRAFKGGSAVEIMLAVRSSAPTAMREVHPSIPEELSAIVERLLHKKPSERPNSANEVAAQLAPPYVGSTTAAGRGLRWAAAGLIAVTVVLLAIMNGLGMFGGSSPMTTLAPVPAGGIASQPRSEEPLRVMALEVHHFPSIDEGNVRPGRIMGSQSYAAKLGDEFTVSARLSRPCYSILVVFRADGMEEVLDPQDDTDVPIQTDKPHYPAKRRDERYYLEEGTGLWAVALIASESPLPSYREWRARHPDVSWRPTKGKAGLVIWDDGQQTTPLMSESSGNTRGSRQSADLAPLTRLTDDLRRQSGGVVSAIGFTVE